MKKLTLSILIGLFTMIGTSNFDQAYSADNTVKKSHFEKITINSNSAAYFDSKGSQAVIFVPGYVFNKESWFFLAERLQKLNIASLSLDGKTSNDVFSAINNLKDKGFKKIALVGGSMGGGAVLHALKKEVDESINKAIALAPYNGVPIKSDRIQKLFIVAKGDNVTSSTSINKFYNDSSEPKKMVEFEGSEHAQHLFKGSHKEKLSELIIDFITD